MALLTTSNLFAFLFGVVITHMIHRRRYTTTLAYNRVVVINLMVYEAFIIATTVNNLRGISSYFRRHTRGALWGLTSKHKVLLDDTLVVRLLCQPSHILSKTPMTLRLFAGPIGTKNYDNLGENLAPQLQASIDSTARNFMSDQRVNGFLGRLNIPAKVASLVDLSKSHNPGHWERCVRLQTLSPEQLPDSVIVDDFYQLIRDFGTYLNILVMFGRGFYDRNPSIIYDYWKWDDQALLPTVWGIPEWWPLRSLREGIAARTRIQRAMSFFSMGVTDKLANISDVQCTIIPDTIASRTNYRYTRTQEATFLHAHLFSASTDLNTTLA